jgi:eukaryotic-like serine/threonine-protein kinase
MTAERWVEVRALLQRALELTVEQRAEFVKQQASDPELAAEVSGLLAFERESDGMFSVETWKMAVPGAAIDAMVGESTIGSYRLLKELGRGGMGAVYLAERADGVYQQQVAVKILQDSIFTPALAERFKQERQLLARLQHPGIARLLDGGVTSSGRPYLVMEYVAGKPIDVFCEAKGLDVRARLQLFLRMAQAVQAAHQQLVLHLDLKPANILVTAEGEPRLLDFGIARLLSEAGDGASQTEATLRLLTPRYASPEQASGAPLGVASDVFSLATLLYKLLTGRLPYPIEDKSPLDAAQMLRDVPPMLPSAAAPPKWCEALRGDLDMILLQGLRKEPVRRYPTVAALAEDVERHLQSEPVHAHADTIRYRAGKFLRRNRVAAIVSALAALVVVVSGIAVVRSAVVARRERATAERRLKDMRALAHSYVFDLDPKLEAISGTVDVRHFVLENAQKYLEAMSHEVKGDEDLMRETAQGYSRIGQVLDTPNMPSLHDPKAAEAAMEKGIMLEKFLVAKHPGDLKELSTLFQQMRHFALVSGEYGDLDRSRQLLMETWEVGQPLLKAGPSQLRFQDMGSVAKSIAGLYAGNGDQWGFGDPLGAKVWLQRSQEIIDAVVKYDPKRAQKFQMMQSFELQAYYQANLLSGIGQPEKAGPLFEEALRLTTVGEPSVYQVQSRKAYREIYADYLTSMHQATAAAAFVPDLLSDFKEAGNDRLLNSDAATGMMVAGRIQMETGRQQEGKRLFARGMHQMEEIYKHDPDDANISAVLAWNNFQGGDVSVFSPAERREMYLRAEEIANVFERQHPSALSAALLVGQCEMSLAELARSTSSRVEAKSRDEAARAEFQKVLAAHPNQPKAKLLLAKVEALTTTD